jgi:hypothetical protein
MDEIVKHYVDNLNTNGFKPLEIIAFEPAPNEQDYNNQYIFRYFIRKRNEQNGLIYEVKKDMFDLSNQNKLYIGVRIQWKIYGDKMETEELNKKSVAYGKHTISNLDTYINNYIKFWKG